MDNQDRDGISRRDFLKSAGIAGSAVAANPLLGAGPAAAAAIPQDPPAVSAMPTLGALRPQQNEFRNLMDLSGLWQFQLDPKGEGEDAGWMRGLPSPRLIPVPASWNDLFDDAADYLGFAWYALEAWLPRSWDGQKIFLRVYSAEYATKIWLNGELLGEHLGGHLPFAFQITGKARCGQANRLALRVENLQKRDRVPPGPRPGHASWNDYPATTYDFFPYAGLDRQVAFYSCPPTHLEDVTVTTQIEGADGVVTVAAVAGGNWSGTGRAEIATGADAVSAELNFSGGKATAELRLPRARFWSPDDPYLYPLALTLLESGKPSDAYRLQIGVRTFAVAGDRLLLNGKPVILRGANKHEDFPLHGKGLDLPQLIRDYQLLKWMGANAYRTSHYPYSEEAMELADRIGILIIDEIPAVGLDFSETNENIQAWNRMAQGQLRDLVARDKNHASVIMWSVANEPGAGSPQPGGKHSPQAVAAGGSYLTKMVAWAHRLDSTRPATFASAQGSPEEWLTHVDAVGINRYYGWYVGGGRIEEAGAAVAKELDELYASLKRPIMLTEFGAGTVAGGHGLPPGMWSEEYQAELIRAYLDAADERPFMAATLVWCFADFKTPQSIIRVEGVNKKGVFTRDRRPKQAAHMLRRRWRGQA